MLLTESTPERKSPRAAAARTNAKLLTSSPSKPVTPTRKRALSKMMPKTPGYEESVPKATPSRTVALRAIYGTAVPKPRLPAVLRKELPPKRRSMRRSGVKAATWADIVRKDAKSSSVAAGKAKASRVGAGKAVRKRRAAEDEDEPTTVRFTGFNLYLKFLRLSVVCFL